MKTEIQMKNEIQWKMKYNEKQTKTNENLTMKT